MKKFLILVFFLLIANMVFATYDYKQVDISVTSGTATAYTKTDLRFKVLAIRVITDNVNHGDSLTVSIIDDVTGYAIYAETDTSITSDTAEQKTVSSLSTSCVVAWSDTGTDTDEGSTITATATGSDTDEGTTVTTSWSDSGVDNGTTMTVTVSGSVAAPPIPRTISMTDTDTANLSPRTITNAVTGTATTTTTETNYYAVGPIKVTATFGEVQTGNRSVTVTIIGEK